LFATSGHDLRALLRGDFSDAQITAAVAHLWGKRTDRYSELRTINTDGLSRADRKVEMSYIGG
jgi:cyclic pyranopterin phosphate synthase